jgi:hypothetical protein
VGVEFLLFFIIIGVSTFWCNSRFESLHDISGLEQTVVPSLLPKVIILLDFRKAFNQKSALFESKCVYHCNFLTSSLLLVYGSELTSYELLKGFLLLVFGDVLKVSISLTLALRSSSLPSS